MHAVIYLLMSRINKSGEYMKRFDFTGCCADWLDEVYKRDGSRLVGGQGCVVSSMKNRKRDENQDRAVIIVGKNGEGKAIYTCVVADGVAGSAHGGRAASLAASGFVHFLYADRFEGGKKIKDAVNYANAVVRSAGDGASTLSAIVACESDAYCVWIGDTRVYQICGDDLVQVSRDESAEELLGGGNFFSKNVLVNFIGQDGVVDVNISKVDESGKYILMTDGAYNPLHKIIKDVKFSEMDGPAILKSINVVSDMCGGYDNCTMIYVDMKQDNGAYANDSVVSISSHRDVLYIPNDMIEVKSVKLAKSGSGKRGGQRRSRKKQPSDGVGVIKLG